MKKNNIQMTGVATVAAKNGNGNGNGKKAKAEPKPQNNVKIVPWDEFDRKNAIKIIPHLNFLTDKGIEIYTNMGNLENAKLFIDDLAMSFGGETTELTGLMMLLDAIRQKINKDDCLDSPEDFICFLQDYLFYYLHECNRAVDVYIDAVRSGNFVVGKKPEGEYKVSEIDIRPPKHKVKANENALRAEIDALAETVKGLRERINGNGLSQSRETHLQTQESEVTKIDCKTASGSQLAQILSDLVYNDNLPFMICNHLMDGIFEAYRASGEELPDVNISPEFVTECFEKYESSRSSKKRITHPETEYFDPNNGEGDTLEELRGGMLALALAALLENPNLPEEIHDGIVDAIGELSNHKGNSFIYNSSEFIAKTLEFHEIKKAEEQEPALAE